MSVKFGTIMSSYESDRYSQVECVTEFLKLFPHGFAGRDVIAEIAPDGWDRTPMVANFHPSLEQLFQEAIESHKNLQELRSHIKRKDDEMAPVELPPTIEQVRERFKETPIDAPREVAELVGRCLWDVFSDNHEVLGPDRRAIDIGSFRGAGGFIADELNRQIGATCYDYMSFYMGTSWIICRADVLLVYEMIFKRLKSRKLDWVYHFPRLNLIDLQPLRESLKPEHEPEWADYSPESALARERDEQDRRQQVSQMREKMDEDHARIVEEARIGPPPRTAVAYQKVYGHLPQGWPPK